ncbi:glycosyltransferase family 4 protein [Xinfangfangia pollutisoli]|uniref:glycosyltransferase family 4 protein n=1 Tax=Xinfangfangia pollutisoli TaxID=2865960 RepID=UPI001CD2C923|nr:glycosyltransferase family 4 protein [Xinfangfangia pollutisoli]
MKLAYLVNTYPLPSQTFIRREIQALERMDWQIHRFALRSDRARLVDPADIAEDSRTEHLLKPGLWRLARTALPFAAKRPAAAFRALRLALACGARGAGGAPGTGGRLRHLVYWLEAAQLARRCHEDRLPHIHAHFGTNSATVAMLAAEIGGLSFSFTVHGPEEFDAPRAHSLALKVARAEFTVAISSYGRAQLCRWVDVGHWDRIHVVHCGIEPWRFPEPEPLPEGPLKLVAIGRLAEQKGFPLLVEALPQALRAVPDLHLTLIGEGPFRPLIERQIAGAGIGAHVTLTGWLEEADVRARLAAAHVLVLPSFAEGLPMVVMEAFAAGRPAIASAIMGVPELVSRETGWLVAAGDPQALAQAIVAAAALPRARLAEMGRNARAAVMAQHDITRLAEDLAGLFASGGRP